MQIKPIHDIIFQHSHHVSVNNGLNVSPFVEFLGDRNPLLGHRAIREPLSELPHRWKISSPPHMIFQLAETMVGPNCMVLGLDSMEDDSIHPIENVEADLLLCATCGVLHCRAGEQCR